MVQLVNNKNACYINMHGCYKSIIIPVYFPYVIPEPYLSTLIYWSTFPV